MVTYKSSDKHYHVAFSLSHQIIQTKNPILSDGVLYSKAVLITIPHRPYAWMLEQVFLSQALL